MPSLEQLKDLGQTLREARKAKKLTLEDVEELSGVNKNYVWIIEETYVAPKRSPTVPSDEKLAALAGALGIPTFELHAILGRCQRQDAAGVLVRELLRELGERTLGTEELAAISSEIKALAKVSIDHRMRELQAQGGR